MLDSVKMSTIDKKVKEPVKIKQALPEEKHDEIGEMLTGKNEEENDFDITEYGLPGAIKDIAEGKSLGEVVKNLVNSPFKAIADFVKDIIGKKDSE